MSPDDLPDSLNLASEEHMLPRDRIPAHDYHGLKVEEAMVKFISDYSVALRFPQESQQFRVIHGYGSTGHGGRIKTILREMLTFEMVEGVLTFRESEYLDRHPGYTIISPISDLNPIPASIFSSPLSSRDIGHSIRRLNSLIDSHRTKKSLPLTKYPALNSQALDDLSHVFDNNSDQNKKS